mmetsp:Transcript_11331/g.27172  ORF Transcript_11331/g.27172 Transcript_11331/m.27172 type:complete len:87 (+) Transcript_11331:194-454(+)
MTPQIQLIDPSSPDYRILLPKPEGMLWSVILIYVVDRSRCQKYAVKKKILGVLSAVHDHDFCATSKDSGQHLVNYYSQRTTLESGV